MGEKIIPLADLRHVAPVPAVPAGAAPPNGLLSDALGRPLRDLRISVTDRCNFRCGYCMPREVFGRDYPFLPHASLLTFEEITRLARIFVAHGVQKIRLTGGEPLLRKDIERLVAMLATLRTADGEALDLTLTTNGSALQRKARALKEAGLQRITVSLDAIDDAVFRRMNDAAQQAGLGPIKVNMVVQRGTNDHEVLAMARRFRGTGIVLRFIEFMDVGASNGWRMDEVVPSSELAARIAAAHPIEPLDAAAPGETAQRWRYRDGAGEIGFISSVTQAFCRDCNRARLATDGKLYLCLFASRGHDLRALLRGGADDVAIAAAIGAVWGRREDRYSELRASAGPATPGDRRIEMHYIGG